MSAPAPSSHAASSSSSSGASSRGLLSSVSSFFSSLSPAQKAALGLAAFFSSSVALTYLRQRLAARQLAGAHTHGETDDGAMPPLEAVPPPAQPKPKKKKAPIVVPHREWSEEEFTSVTQDLLSMLGGVGQLNEEQEAALHAALPQVQRGMSVSARALAAHFLLATHAFHLNKAESEQEFEEFYAKQIIDMRTAWELLDVGESDNDEEARSLDILRLQIAQCMRDPQLMLPVFERFLARPFEQLMQDEQMLLFTTAPVLGRWSTMVRLGEKLAETMDLSETHGAPLDYAVLLELAKEEASRGDAPLSQIQWSNNRIVWQRMKLLDTECDDPLVLESLETEFTQDGERTWKVIVVEETHSRLARVGALCQMRSLSRLPLALAGPANDRTLRAKGWSDLDSHLQTEDYTLRRVERSELDSLDDDVAQPSRPELASFWKGEYRMLQAPKEGGPQFGPEGRPMPKLQVRFEFEMCLEVMPASQ